MKNLLKNNAIHDATLLAYRRGAVCIDESKGEMDQDSAFALACISKLYTHTLIFRLIDRDALAYAATLTDVLPRNVTTLLPKAGKVTVRHLIDQNSGFANYEMDRLPSGSVLMDELLQCDRRVEFDEALTILSQLPPRSELSGSKAYYSDINAMLLGTIAETLTGKTAAQLLADDICQPLGLTQTHWANGGEKIAPIYNGKRLLACQQYLASQRYHDGVIATNHELMRFSQAFFGGELFGTSHITRQFSVPSNSTR